MNATSTSESGKPATKPNEKYHSYPFWAPRFWHGMRTGTVLKLMARSKFRITPWRWFLAFNIVLISLSNSLLAGLHRLIYGRRIEKTQLVDDPIFIIGHWRSGTTYLHELFVLDERLASPTTHECFVPHHALLTRWWFNHVLKYLIPSKRPMDNVIAGWDRPQEDEFALCNLGVGSPYTRIAFPNDPCYDQGYLGMENVSAEQRTTWKSGFQWFLKLLTLRSNKRIVLKSPTHTARIKVLLEMYPNAKFVHIVRDPLVVFPSTVRLWKSLYKIQGLQVPNYDGLNEFVFQNFEQMFEKFEVEQHLIPAGNLYTIRYEDLVKNTVGQMQAIYEQLRLGEFDQIRPLLEREAEKSKEYKTNKFTLDPALHDEIVRRCGNYRRRHGYESAPEPETVTTLPAAPPTELKPTTSQVAS